MTIRLRTAFFIFIGLVTLSFLYIERAILIPFILAAIFAYIFNPIVNFASHKVKLPRSLSILIIYALIITGIIILGSISTRQILQESTELRRFSSSFIATLQEQVNLLPSWLKPEVKDLLSSFEKSRFLSSSSIITLFPRAVSGVFSLLVFLFSAFYFLKEGRRIFDRALRYIPNDYKIEVEILTRKINSVFGGYLRGILLLILIVALATYVSLAILGVRFALILAIFSGFAEIIPFIGPISAGAVAAIVVLLNGTSNFPLTPIQGAIVVAIIYFVIRQIQDYLITPQIMGKIVGLHPVVILFSVLAGEHLWGPMGFILGVPVAATIRILLEFYLDKVNEKTYSAKQS
ncbi:MAG: AI-2E family transporter [Patescibacteria group bacterium]|nr:AI-2E family transporter [Patescibacteria group bacterium]